MIGPSATWYHSWQYTVSRQSILAKGAYYWTSTANKGGETFDTQKCVRIILFLPRDRHLRSKMGGVSQRIESGIRRYSLWGARGCITRPAWQTATGRD
jgi:hypothetical protein